MDLAGKEPNRMDNQKYTTKPVAGEAENPADEVSRRLTHIERWRDNLRRRNGLRLFIDGRGVDVTGAQALRYSAVRAKALEAGILLPPGVAPDEWEAILKLRLGEAR